MDGATPLKRVQEESYFFRLGDYTERLIAHIEAHAEFIQPSQYYNAILGRLHKEGLRDLSLSRTSFNWGIAMPDGFDKRHVMCMPHFIF
jgi:methionyl-tRNA synthetase